jgi:SAM-dependent methyltransferase
MSSQSFKTVSGSEYYATNYGNYERQNPRYKLEFYLSLVRRWVPKGGELFELGVGLGKFLREAAREYRCSGSDVNTFGVAQTKANVPEAIEIDEGSYECIPMDPSPDGVVAWDVLEHIPDLDNALEQIHRRLRDDGVLVAVVPVYDGPLGWLVTLLDKDPTHVSKFSRREWLTRLKRHGYQVVEYGGILRYLFLGRWYVHLTRPQWFFRWCGSALYFVARKRHPANTDPLLRQNSQVER